MKCEDKKVYNYYLDAGHVVYCLLKNNIRRYIYLCCECDRFHLTSKQPDIKKKKKSISIKSKAKKLGIYKNPNDK